MSYMKRHLLELQERNEQRIAERNKHAKQRMEQQGLFSEAPVKPASRPSVRNSDKLK